MEKDIHERENNFFIIEIALVFCLIITVLCFVTDGFGIENIQRNRFDSNILFLFVPVGVALINLAIVSYALFIFNKKNHKEDFEPQRIISKCVKCGKEFPAVTYGFSKSNYGVGVPESMKDHQNGDLEFYEKNKCDDCMLEERAKEEEAFENMIEECLKHGCQENCGDKYKEENEKLKYQNARMSRMIFSMRNCSNCNGIIYGGQRTEKCKRCEMFSHWEFDDRTEKHI